MPKFIFECPECGGGMEADTNWSGAPVQCPHCLEPVTIRLNKAKKPKKAKKQDVDGCGCLLLIIIIIIIVVVI